MNNLKEDLRDVVKLALEERAVAEIIVREDIQKKFDGVGAFLRWKPTVRLF